MAPLEISRRIFFFIWRTFNSCIRHLRKESPNSCIRHFRKGSPNSCIRHLRKGSTNSCIRHFRKGSTNSCIRHLRKGSTNSCIRHLRKGSSNSCIRHWEALIYIAENNISAPKMLNNFCAIKWKFSPSPSLYIFFPSFLVLVLFYFSWLLSSFFSKSETLA